MTRIYLLALLFLVGCASTNHIPEGTAVSIVWDKTPAGDVKFVCSQKMPLPHQSGVGGCVYWEGKVAHLVAPDTDTNDCLLGHEFRHIFDGDYHSGKPGYLSLEECLGVDWHSHNKYKDYDFRPEILH